MINGRLAFWESNIDLGTPVTDHYVVEQPAQRLGVFGLASIGLFQKMIAKAAHRAQLTRRQNRDQAVQLHQIILDGRRRQEQDIAFANLVDKLPG